MKDGCGARSSFVSLALAAVSCAGRINAPYAAPPHGHVEARAYHYRDEAGLRVSTLGVQASQDLSSKVRINASALVDEVVLSPPAPLVQQPPGPGQPSGHLHPGVDVITSASVVATDTPARSEKWRFEGIAGSTLTTTAWGQPAEFQGVVRASTEPDYHSLSARLIGRLELFERNTTVTGFVGFGHDTMTPTNPPPGQESLWPASHNRITAGSTVSQLISPAFVASGGFGFTHQEGVLWSPYRRAAVISTLFPEVVPRTRERLTSFLALSYFIGGGTALHLRQGLYVDSWRILGLIPEAALAKEMGERGLVSFRYRYYWQGAANFYAPIYYDFSRYLSGDPRLGDLREHVGSFELRWTPWGRAGFTNSVTIMGSYEMSSLSYPMLRNSTRAQVFSLGLIWVH